MADKNNILSTLSPHEVSGIGFITVMNKSNFPEKTISLTPIFLLVTQQIYVFIRNHMNANDIFLNNMFYLRKIAYNSKAMYANFSS